MQQFKLVGCTSVFKCDFGDFCWIDDSLTDAVPFTVLQGVVVRGPATQAFLRLQVWQRFEEIATSRILQIPEYVRAFDPQDFFQTMEENRHALLLTMERHWREYVISEVRTACIFIEGCLALTMLSCKGV